MAGDSTLSDDVPEAIKNAWRVGEMKDDDLRRTTSKVGLRRVRRKGRILMADNPLVQLMRIVRDARSELEDAERALVGVFGYPKDSSNTPADTAHSDTAPVGGNPQYPHVPNWPENAVE